jgi:hypothetical protein
MPARSVLTVALSMLALVACGSDVPLGGGADGGSSSSGVDAMSPDAREATSGSTDGASDAGAGDSSSGSSSGGAAGPSVVANFASLTGTCLGKMAVDATHVYVVPLGGQGAIYAAPLAGGSPISLGGLGNTMLAISSTAAYTADDSCQPVIAACAKSGPGQATNLTVAADSACLLDLAADDANVYWAAAVYSNPDAGTGAVGKVPADGGAFTVLAREVSPRAVVVGGDTLFYVTSELPASPWNFSVMSVPVDGGAPTVVVPAPLVSAPLALTVDATNVYYGTYDGYVFQVPRSGGTPTMLAKGVHVDDAGDIDLDGSTAWALGHQMAVDADRVYFRIADVIEAVPIGGGPLTTLATTSSLWDCGFGLAIDATYVYWTDGTTVMKVAK